MKSFRRHKRMRNTRDIKEQQPKYDSGELLRDITQRVLRILITVFAYLGYYVEVRPYFANHHGIWSVGFLDGAVITSTLFVIVFYMWSTLNSRE